MTRGWLLPGAIALLAHGVIAFVPALDVSRPRVPTKVSFAASSTPPSAEPARSRPALARDLTSAQPKPNTRATAPAPRLRRKSRPPAKSVKREAESLTATAKSEPPSLAPAPAEPARSVPDTARLLTPSGPVAPPPAPKVSPVERVAGPSKVPNKATSGNESIGSYAHRVRRRMEQQKRYPRGARRREQQGIAAVKLTIGVDGRLLETPVLVSSSGFRLLDAEVLRMAAAAQPYPRPPARPHVHLETRNPHHERPRGRVQITVPVRFSM